MIFLRPVLLFLLLGIGVPIFIYFLNKFKRKKIKIPYIYDIHVKSKGKMGKRKEELFELIISIIMIVLMISVIADIRIKGINGNIKKIYIVDNSPSLTFPEYRYKYYKEVIDTLIQEKDIIITSDCQYNNIEYSFYKENPFVLNIAELYPLSLGEGKEIHLISDHNFLNGQCIFHQVKVPFGNYIYPKVEDNKVYIRGKGSLFIENNGRILQKKEVLSDTFFELDKTIKKQTWWFENDELLFEIGNVPTFSIEKTVVDTLLRKIFIALGMKEVKENADIGYKGKITIKFDTVNFDNIDYIKLDKRAELLSLYKFKTTTPKGKVFMWTVDGYPVCELKNDTVFFYFSPNPYKTSFVVSPYFMYLLDDVISNIFPLHTNILFKPYDTKYNVPLSEHPPFKFNFSERIKVNRKILYKPYPLFFFFCAIFVLFQRSKVYKWFG